MDDDAELRALRARAYGPRPDISDADLARLSDLEAAQRQRRRRRPAAHEPGPPRALTRATPASDDVDAIGEMPLRSETDSRTDTGTDTDTTTSAVPAAPATLASGADEPDGAPERRWRSAVVGLAWAGSLVLVGAVAISVTAFATSRTAATATSVPPDAGVSHVVTLLPATDVDAPEFFGGERGGSLASFDPFFGLRAFESPSGWMPGDGRCLTIVRLADLETATNNSYSGPVYQGCAAGPFPATVQMVVDSEAPADLRDRYPQGTALQFVRRDDGVDVFASAPAGTSEP